MNQTGPCPGAPGDRGQTVSLINKLNAMLGRHVLQQGGELRVGPEPATGQSCAGAGSWEQHGRGRGEKGPGAAGSEAQLLHTADCSGALAWDAWERMRHGLGSRCWVQEL